MSVFSGGTVGWAEYWVMAVVLLTLSPKADAVKLTVSFGDAVVALVLGAATVVLSVALV